MKHLGASLSLFFCCVCNLFAQEGGGNQIYQTSSNIPVVPCDVRGIPFLSSQHYLIPPYGAKFAVVNFLNRDTVVVRFLTWGDSSYRKQFNDPLDISKLSPQSKFLTSGFSSFDSYVAKYFLMRKIDVDERCVRVYNTWFKSMAFTMGLVTMPMRLRLGKNFDFTGNLSIGSTAGVKLRMSQVNRNFINFLFGASISTVSLDSFNTNGKIINQPISNVAVFSPSVGVVLEFDRAQIGFFYGWDLLSQSNQSRYEWIYNRKPWISLGFGFSIFSVEGQSANKLIDKQ